MTKHFAVFVMLALAATPALAFNPQPDPPGRPTAQTAKTVTSIQAPAGQR